MAGSVNKAIIVGNVGKDPEIRRTQDGRPIANLSLATSESWKDKHTGERKEKTEWHRVVVFNENLCKIIEQYVHKGDKLYIEGALQTRKWTDQSGAEKYSTEIVLQGYNGVMTILASAGGSQSRDDRDDDRQSSIRRSDHQAPARSREPVRDLLDDEIPFAWIAIALMAAPLALRLGGLA